MATFNTQTNSTQTTRTRGDSDVPAQHFLNIHLQGKQIGYLVVDKFPELVEVLQRNPDNGTKLIQMCTGTYRERGVTQVTFDLDSFA